MRHACLNVRSQYDCCYIYKPAPTIHNKTLYKPPEALYKTKNLFLNNLILPMKLQRSTLILMLLASLAGGFVYVYEIQGAPEREAAKTKQQQIFSFKEQDVQSLTVKNPKQMLAFERVSQEKQQTPGQPSWLVKVLNSAPAAQPATCKAPAAGKTAATCQAPPPPPPPPPSASAKPPEKPATSSKPAATASPSGSAKPAEKPAKDSADTSGVPASDASVTFLLNLLTTGKSDRTLVMTDPGKQRQEYGLEQPVATVEVKLNNQQSHRLILGKPDFNGTFLYAQADPPADQSEAIEVLLVSPDFQNAVNRPLSEWKSSEKDSKQSENTSKDKDSKPAPKETGKGIGGSADKSAPQAPK
jgi:hypothetical protein